jgi:hypothetical protein
MKRLLWLLFWKPLLNRGSAAAGATVQVGRRPIQIQTIPQAATFTMTGCVMPPIHIAPSGTITTTAGSITGNLQRQHDGGLSTEKETLWT